MARSQSNSAGVEEESLRKDCGEGHEMEGVEDESHPRGRRSSSHLQHGPGVELPAMPTPGTSNLTSASRSRSLSSNQRPKVPSARKHHQDTASRDVEVLLRENEALRLQLEHETQRVRAAEMAAGLSKQQAAPPDEMAKGSIGELASHVHTLEAEVAKLRAELEESRSHIFSLQPYRREITPEEVASDWELLFAGVSDCVERLVGPTLDSDVLHKEVLQRARKHPATWSSILKHMYQQPDLAQAAWYPDTDLDVLIAIVMRHLNEHVFQTTLYGARPAYVAAVAAIENSMAAHVEPRRDQLAIRNWRAEALGALIADPNLYPAERAASEAVLADELAALFRVFLPHNSEPGARGQAEAARAMLRDGCVRPAIDLHEKLLVSTHHFYTTLDGYYVHGTKKEGSGLVTSPDLYPSLDKLDCRNILQNRKTVTRARIGADGSADPQRALRTVLALTPAVYVRQVGQRDMVKEPALVCKQQMLVAWGSQERREAFIRGGDKTLLAHLFPTSGSSRQGGVLDIFGGSMSWGFSLAAAKKASEPQATAEGSS
ncbi:hypothetical protein RB595_008527 [Gaeumannomyces hyphopodioides]